jgi:hypothetical protein
VNVTLHLKFVTARFDTTMEDMENILANEERQNLPGQISGSEGQTATSSFEVYMQALMSRPFDAREVEERMNESIQDLAVNQSIEKVSPQSHDINFP